MSAELYRSRRSLTPADNFNRDSAGGATGFACRNYAMVNVIETLDADTARKAVRRIRKRRHPWRDFQPKEQRKGAWVGILYHVDFPLHLLGSQIEWFEIRKNQSKVNRYVKKKINTPIYIKLKEGEFFVDDGQHRSVAAWRRGDETIRALVPQEVLDELN